ncbi:MAG: glycosyltransferase family 2 protein [Niabella sp.]
MRPAFIPSYIAKHLKPADWYINNIPELRIRMQSFQSETPSVSVIIPAYNEEENILRTLSSIAANSTKYKTEIIVVDNNSIDNTKKLVQQSGATYIFEGKKGVKNARNTGLQSAKGKYIINADADTIYSPFWIDELITPLYNNSEIAVSYGRFAFLPEKNTNRLAFYLYELLGDIYKGINAVRKDKAMYIYGCSSAYRREQGLAVNGYEHPLGANEDGYLGLKLRNKFGKLNKVTTAKSFAWTSGRKFVADGTLTNRIFKKIKSSEK